MVLCDAIPSASGSASVPHYELHELLEEFMDIFRGYLDRYCHIRGGYGRLRHMYLSHLWRKDEPAVFFDNSSSSGFTGMIRGLSDVGHLLIETNEGELREFAFKEVSYIIAD